MSTEEITNILQTIFAAIGLLITIVGTIFGIRNVLKNRRPMLKVTLNNGMVTSGPHTSDIMFMFHVANIGEKPIIVSAIELVWRDQPLIIPHISGERILPTKLMPQEGVNFWHSLRNVAYVFLENGVTGIANVKARVRDAVGNEYLSKEFPLNIDEWTKQPLPTK